MNVWLCDKHELLQLQLPSFFRWMELLEWKNVWHEHLLTSRLTLFRLMQFFGVYYFSRVFSNRIRHHAISRMIKDIECIERIQQNSMFLPRNTYFPILCWILLCVLVFSDLKLFFPVPVQNPRLRFVFFFRLRCYNCLHYRSRDRLSLHPDPSPKYLYLTFSSRDFL